MSIGDNIKVNLFGVQYSVTDYAKATARIIENAVNNHSFGVSALAVHGLMECYYSKELKEKVNKIDMVVPDGQPVRWAMNYFFKSNLKDRVYGPTLTWEVLKKANELSLRIFLYGSDENTLNLFAKKILQHFPNIIIAGLHIDRFREATLTEDKEDIVKINKSGAQIVLVGRGCPRQELWVSNHLGSVNAVMMAVGAAFNFHAGNIKQAPLWMQNAGLEWLFRLTIEPKRLWKRYLITNSTFIYLFALKVLKLKN